MLNVVRELFINIDAIVYELIAQIFQLIINLANFDLFKPDVLKSFASRVYVILGLVMAFKLFVAFIQILIDPDKMSDKENGVGNVIKRVAFSMLLIVLVPSIFSTAKKLQNMIVPYIPQVILGVNANVDSQNVDSDATTTGASEEKDGNVVITTSRLMSYYSFLPFFYYSDEACNDGTLAGTGEDDSKAIIYSVDDAANHHVNDKCDKGKGGYKYDYKMFISTVVGAYLIYVLVTVALKIAIRTIKFGICQLIAPIPIASYIDPGSSKKAFDNWVSTSVKVYLDLFVRLMSVYFVIFVFSILFDGGKLKEIIGNFGMFQGLLLTLFIIIGLLNFVKEMPKFVTGMLGLSDSFSDIGDMFKGQGWRSLSNAAMPIRAGIDSAKMSKGAGESGGLRAARGLLGAAGATGAMLKNIASGKSGRESSLAALSSVHSKTRTSIARTNTFANEDGTIDLNSLRRGYSAQRAAEHAVARGEYTEKEEMDSMIANFEKVASVVADGRKSMAGHKIAKAYQQRYEAIKNTSEEAYQEQIRVGIQKQIDGINDTISRTTDAEQLRRLNNAKNNLQRQMSTAAIRERARELKFKDVNEASRAVDDVQKRLFAMASAGPGASAKDFLNAEDARVAATFGFADKNGNFDDSKIWNDGQIMTMANSNAQNSINAINDAIRKDPKLLEAFRGLKVKDKSDQFVNVLDAQNKINILNMDVAAAGNLKDETSRLATQKRNSPEYIQQSSITPRNQDKKN